MNMMTLDEFIKEHHNRAWPVNAYVEAKGFDSFYIRYGDRYVNGEKHKHVLDIANIVASKPGSGVFTVLVERLRREYPDISLYVENALDPRFGAKLARMGFLRVGEQHPFSYFLVRAGDAL